MRATRSKPAMEKMQSTLDVLVASNERLTKKVDKLDSLSTKIDRLSNLMESFVLRVDQVEATLLEHGNQNDIRDERIKSLEKGLLDAQNEINQLEMRSRKFNLRLLKLPELCESGSTLVAFLAQLLSDTLGIPIRDEDIEVAHRIGSYDPKKTRPVIFKLHRLQKKFDILEAAKSRTDGLLLPSNPRITLRITTDPTTREREIRNTFWPLREKLHEKGVKTAVRNPGTLCIWFADDFQKFTTLQAATDTTKAKFPDFVF